LPRLKHGLATTLLNAPSFGSNCKLFLVFLYSTLFVWLISHQPTVLLSQNKPVTSNQPAVLLSQNKPAPAISHQPNEQAADLQFLLCTC
jgi:hypothetical protein